jgi:hypothetical protein
LKDTIYIKPITVQLDLDTLGQIRSEQGESFLARSILLARYSEEHGIYLWSRASKLNYLLDWQNIQEMMKG